MEEKHSSISNELILNDVTIAYFYSFSFEGQIDVQNIKSYSRLKNHVKAYVSSKESPLNAEAINSGSSVKLNEILRFEGDYYFSEYSSSRKFSYIELESIELDFQDQLIEAKVFLSLHEYGAGTIVFVFENINGITFNTLKNLIFLNEIKSKYSVSYIPIEHISKNNSIDSDYNLTQIFWKLLSWLENAAKVKVNKCLKSHQTKEFTIPEKDCDIYTAVFISDPGAVFSTLEDFIKANKKQIFELISIRYHYKNHNFYLSRNDSYIDSVLKKRLGNRRYISYYLTEERMTAISLAKYHKDLYPYNFRWYFAYISMLNIVRLQFQLLNKLYKLLYLYVQEVKEYPLKLVELRKIIIHGLEEYENLRFPINERSRKLIEQCKEVMNLNRFVEIIENKLAMLTESTNEYFNKVSQAKNDATTRAVNILTIILSIPIAIEIIDKLFINPPVRYYIFAWAGIAILFYFVQKILAWATMRTLHKTRF
ncbi:hypothetical protein ES708_27228 [subsurface metagenome]